MSVNLLFKIAAVGILVSVLTQVQNSVHGIQRLPQGLFR